MKTLLSWVLLVAVAPHLQAQSILRWLLRDGSEVAVRYGNESSHADAGS